jgi:small subunit ribosomal protein S1
MHHDMPIVLLKGVFMNMHTQSGIIRGSHGPEQDNTSKETFQALYEKSLQDIREGGIITGEVIKVEKGMVFVDIGYKSEGEISLSEFRDATGRATVKQGDRIEVVLVRKANEKGFPVLSRNKIEDVRRRKTIEEAFHKGRAVRGRILSPVKGGYAVDIGLRAFLPGSQVDIFPSKESDAWTGTEHEFKILSYDRKNENIVVSRKALLEKAREHQRIETLKQIQEGAILTGRIRKVMDYGLLVDVGAVLGLVHITNISWGKIRDLTGNFKVGDEVSVKVLSFTPDRERISLGMKQLLPDPWPGMGKKYPVGARVDAPVVALKKYGALVELEEGFEGLIPTAALSGTRKITHPSQVLSIGDRVKAVVSGVDPERRQISLSVIDPASQPQSSWIKE